MVKKLFNMIGHALLWMVILALIVLGLPRLFTAISTRSNIFTVDTVPADKAAIVFGAGLQRDGTPSPILRDRVAAAATLYFEGKVQKLLMSGDNRYINYNEPGSMKAYAISLGVPEEDIVLDYAGRRTYDTCYRAKEIFGLNEAILVTQAYHLPRAIFTCSGLGMNVAGVKSDLRTYQASSVSAWNFRELLATPVALWEVWISHPLPVLGDKEPIFPQESGQ
jgi:vancomycin permeability regulator SanA